MTSLHLYVSDPKSRNAKLPRTFVLEHDDATPSSTSSTDLTFKRTALLRTGHSRVYRGILSGYGSEDIRAVCKVVVGTTKTVDMKHEAELYETKLRDLQGHCIPRFYGLYRGSMPTDDAVLDDATCLILEDCGECLGTYFGLSDEVCIKLVQILMAVHKRGVQHNDFHPRNLVVDNIKDPQRLVVIDFEDATDHDCQRKYDIALHRHPPDYDEFGCPELYKVAKQCAVWTPCTVRLCGCYVSLQGIETPEDLLKYGPADTKMYDPETMVKLARACIKDYLRRWEYRRDYVTHKKYKALSPAM